MILTATMSPLLCRPDTLSNLLRWIVIDRAWANPEFLLAPTLHRYYRTEAFFSERDAPLLSIFQRSVHIHMLSCCCEFPLAGDPSTSCRNPVD